MTKLSELRVGAIDEQPRDYGWSRDIRREDVSEARCSGGWVSFGEEEPMMDGFHPLPGFDLDGAEDAAERLRGLPLVLVFVGEERDEFGLALCGGGMDLSWQIAEGYMRLGYLPPRYIARDLPCFSKQLDAGERRILAACRRTLRETVRSARHELARLSRTFSNAA